MIRISVERMNETFGRLLRVIRGRRTRKLKLSRLIGMWVLRYCLLTKFLMRIYDNERSIEDCPVAIWFIAEQRFSVFKIFLLLLYRMYLIIFSKSHHILLNYTLKIRLIFLNIFYRCFSLYRLDKHPIESWIISNLFS